MLVILENEPKLCVLAQLTFTDDKKTSLCGCDVVRLGQVCPAAKTTQNLETIVLV